MVLQKKATVSKAIRSMNKKKIQGYVRTKYPLDKFKRHILYKDRRKANIKENILNDMISKQKFAHHKGEAPFVHP